MPLALQKSKQLLDASEVDKDLFVGSRPSLNNDVEEAGVKLLVLCAKEIQPRSALFGFRGSCRVLHAGVDDARLTPLEVLTVKAAAVEVARSVADGRKTLVTCHMGLNRSSLVAALAMLRLRPNLSARQAIEQIRDRRMKECLHNVHFQHLLEETARSRK